MITYIIPTRDRPTELAHTLERLGALPAHEAEVIVVDNASSTPPSLPLRLNNQVPVRLILEHRNHAAAARNIAARASSPASEWLVMLDDDSHPLNLDHLTALRCQPPDVAAVQAEIWLQPPNAALHADPRRESGGLPEVFIGCGVAIRRDAFLHAAGYDPAFDFYAEEYDLAAKLLLSAHRIVFDPRFQIHHRKVTNRRNMDRILRRLVRNNAWVMQRYAPDPARAPELKRTLKRYASIALKERAEIGYAAGLFDLARSHHRQSRRPLPDALWDRFTGKAACLHTLQAAFSASPFRTASLIEPGKNHHIVVEVLNQLGVHILSPKADADRIIVATLSPGPMLDAFDLLDGAAHAWLLCPWKVPDPAPANTPVLSSVNAAA